MYDSISIRNTNIFINSDFFSEFSSSLTFHSSPPVECFWLISMFTSTILYHTTDFPTHCKGHILDLGMLDAWYFLSVCCCQLLFLAVVCWGDSNGAATPPDWANRSGRLALSGWKLDSMEAVVDRRTLTKLLSILDNLDQPVQPLLERQQS